ncbi:MAG: A24 family peptidase [Caulobacteraceae bacterium]
MPPDLLKSLALSVFALLVLAAALRDLVSYTIPNWISASLALAFVPAAFILGAPLGGIGLALLVGVVLLALGVAMFAAGWVGGGDAKLLAAASLWIGLAGLPRFLLFTGLAGGVLAMILLAIRSAWVRPLLAAGPAWSQRLATPGADTPYGVAIAAGALAAFPGGLLMRLAHGAI